LFGDVLAAAAGFALHFCAVCGDCVDVCGRVMNCDRNAAEEYDCGDNDNQLDE